MWLLILVSMLTSCAVLYRQRVPLLARALGEPESRINGHLGRAPR